MLLALKSMVPPLCSKSQPGKLPLVRAVLTELGSPTQRKRRHGQHEGNNDDVETISARPNYSGLAQTRGLQKLKSESPLFDVFTLALPDSDR